MSIYAELLQEDDEKVRILAAESLLKMSKFGNIAPAIPQLSDALQDKSFRVRLLAVQSLGNLGATAKATIPHILPLVKDEIDTVRATAAWAVANIDPDRIIIEEEPIDDEGFEVEEQP